jgi:hypothetical protein
MWCEDVPRVGEVIRPPGNDPVPEGDVFAKPQLSTRESDRSHEVQQRVFHLLVARLAVVSLAPAAVAAWAVTPIVGAGLGVAFLAWDLWRVRQAAIVGTPGELAFHPANRADYPWLDHEGFRTHLTELHDLGFHPIADCTVTFPGAPEGFARVLVDPQARIYAEVNQIRSGNEAHPVVTTFASVLSEGWSLASTTREVIPTTYAFMCAPKACWSSHPDAPLSDLLRIHVERRERMCRDLILSVGGAGTMEDYVALELARHDERRALVRSVNVPRAILRGLRCERRPQREWLGGYRPSVVLPGSAL